MTTEQRLIVIGMASILVLAVVVVMRWRSSRPRSAAIRTPGLAPGVYLFTSETCNSCGDARSRLREEAVTFEEVVWQRSQRLFDDLGIDAVPSLLVVNAHQRGRLFRGVVPPAGEIH